MAVIARFRNSPFALRELPSGSRQTHHRGDPRWPFWAAIALLVLAIASGGSVQAPSFLKLAVQWIAIGAIGAIVLTGGRPQATRWNWFGWCVAAGIAALPVIQLIPLPATVWQALPGRDMALGTAQLFGFANQAMPLSLDGSATMESLIGALPAFAIFLVAHRLPAPAQVRILLAIVGLALASFVLGVFQVATGQGTLYDTSHQGLPIGLFSNRNHQADLLNVGILLSIVLGSRPQMFPTLTWMRPVLFAAAAAMTAGVIATGSRSGMVLLIYVGAAALFLARRPAWSSRKLALVGLGMGVVPLALVLAGSQVAMQSLHRFDRQQTDQRFEFWPAAIWTAEHYFPAGSGVGTFDPAFRANEPLSIVGEHYVVHAHNEYIEIPLETGLPGILLVLAFFIWWAGATVRVTGSDPRDLDGLLGRIGSAIIPIFLLHSALDYPLRMIGLMTVFAFACGILSRALMPRAPSDANLHRRRRKRPETAQPDNGSSDGFGATRPPQAPIG